MLRAEGPFPTPCRWSVAPRGGRGLGWPAGRAPLSAPRAGPLPVPVLSGEALADSHAPAVRLGMGERGGRRAELPPWRRTVAGPAPLSVPPAAPRFSRVWPRATRHQPQFCAWAAWCLRSRWLWRVPQLRSRQRKKETPRSFSELAGKRHRLTLGFRSSLVWEERQGPRAEMIRRNAVITTLTDTSIHSGLAAALSQGVRGTLHQRMRPSSPKCRRGASGQD